LTYERRQGQGFAVAPRRRAARDRPKAAGAALGTGNAGQLRWADLGAQRLIEGDTNGDMAADLTILVKAPGPVGAAWLVL